MIKLDRLFAKYSYTSYIFGHIHNLQFAETEYTMYVRSGAETGGENEVCPEAKFGSLKKFGFVHAILECASNTARFDFVDSDGTVMYIATSPARKLSAGGD